MKTVVLMLAALLLASCAVVKKNGYWQTRRYHYGKHVIKEQHIKRTDRATAYQFPSSMDSCSLAPVGNNKLYLNPSLPMQGSHISPLNPIELNGMHAPSLQPQTHPLSMHEKTGRNYIEVDPHSRPYAKSGIPNFSIVLGLLLIGASTVILMALIAEPMSLAMGEGLLRLSMILLALGVVLLIRGLIARYNKRQKDQEKPII